MSPDIYPFLCPFARYPPLLRDLRTDPNMTCMSTTRLARHRSTSTPLEKVMAFGAVQLVTMAHLEQVICQNRTSRQLESPVVPPYIVRTSTGGAAIDRKRTSRRFSCFAT
jgi:hypothetical protein